MSFLVDPTPALMTSNAVVAHTMKFDLSHVRHIVVHETFNPSMARHNDAMRRTVAPLTHAQWKLNLVHFYQVDQNWHTGPHGFIDDFCYLMPFCPLDQAGIGSPSWDKRKYLHVEVVGNFTLEKPGGTPTWAHAIVTLGALFRRAGLPVNAGTLLFHHEDPATLHQACPGPNLVKADLIAAITKYLNHPGSPS